MALGSVASSVNGVTEINVDNTLAGGFNLVSYSPDEGFKRLAVTDILGVLFDLEELSEANTLLSY